MCLKSIADKYSSFYVTEKSGQIDDCDLPDIYTVQQINRNEKNFLSHFIKLFVLALKIMKKERPDVVITTGALVAFPFCVIAKLYRKKVVYIESFARVNNKSLTGRLVYPFADLFLIQWESLKECYPKAKYVGGIF